MLDVQIRRKCRRLLRELDVRPPLDVGDLCSRYAASRGRPITLLPYPIEIPGPYGLWLKTRTADYIVYQQETTRPHQDHIILHELGHILSGHQGMALEVTGGFSADIESTSPDGDLGPPSQWSLGMRRTCYDTGDEREAEVVATTILEWAFVLDRLPPIESADDPELNQAESALRGRTRWV